MNVHWLCVDQNPSQQTPQTNIFNYGNVTFSQKLQDLVWTKAVPEPGEGYRLRWASGYTKIHVHEKLVKVTQLLC